MSSAELQWAMSLPRHGARIVHCLATRGTHPALHGWERAAEIPSLAHRNRTSCRGEILKSVFSRLFIYIAMQVLCSESEPRITPLSLFQHQPVASAMVSFHKTDSHKPECCV